MPDITYVQLFLVNEQTNYTSMDLTVLQTCSFPKGLNLANSDLSEEKLVIVAVSLFCNFIVYIHVS